MMKARSPMSGGPLYQLIRQIILRANLSLKLGTYMCFYLNIENQKFRGPLGPNFQFVALWACWTQSFALFGRSGRVMMIASYTYVCTNVRCMLKMGTNKQTDGKLNSRSRMRDTSWFPHQLTSRLLQFLHLSSSGCRLAGQFHFELFAQNFFELLIWSQAPTGGSLQVHLGAAQI